MVVLLSTVTLLLTRWVIVSRAYQPSSTILRQQFHRLCMTAVDTSFFYSKKDFHQIGLTKTMDGVLTYLNVEKPSKIQALTFQDILQGQSCIVADQTGSGKTLAYLLPTMQRIIELIRNDTIPVAPSRSPYLLVSTPTTELANQVARVVREMAHILKFRSSCVTSASDMDSEQRKLRLGVEVLVCTPGRLLALIKRQEISLKLLQTVVLDEADILFMDQSFPLQPIGEACPLSAQFIFTTATLPEIVVQQIVAEFPDLKQLSGPGLHRIAPTVEEILIDCSGPPGQTKNAETAFENKRLALLRSLEQTESDRTLVFCNTIPQCRAVENALQRADRNGRLRNVYPYHSAIDFQTREANLAEFSKPLLKLPAVLICTDRASRGMDFAKARVDHVILFDFPQEPSGTIFVLSHC